MVRMPEGWERQWPEFYNHLVTYRRIFRANRHDDAADVLTGIVERELPRRTRDSLLRLAFV